MFMYPGKREDNGRELHDRSTAVTELGQAQMLQQRLTMWSSAGRQLTINKTMTAA